MKKRISDFLLDKDEQPRAPVGKVLIYSLMGVASGIVASQVVNADSGHHSANIHCSGPDIVPEQYELEPGSTFLKFLSPEDGKMDVGGNCGQDCWAANCCSTKVEWGDPAGSKSTDWIGGWSGWKNNCFRWGNQDIQVLSHNNNILLRGASLKIIGEHAHSINVLQTQVKATDNTECMSDGSCATARNGACLDSGYHSC
ncbi:hypothetical protein HN419_01890 [Candidatus Woesearchaeota archaeon]|jgi:hypothetical protein|nr:hypothetical protein [Candidatus Woesearchaeota archaeon]MBT3537252.1 hypothetical protein [Candidatus Woesearchaeota archaeon]MBT4698391.1 hypothetical protein [Candidatus Woesearchaeota archaeon]MBT7106438.1 hypothetical protein [Candidatus Woesearchaeota archaeon]MBT7931187.1 hypothetical protein [Candidatus Woesearchaeota archaeon]